MSATKKMFTLGTIPSGGIVSFPDGTTAAIAIDGSVMVPNAFVSAMLAAGWLSQSYADRILNSPALVIGSTDTKIATGAFDYQIGAASALVNTYKKKGAVAAGTTLASGTIRTNAAGLWGLIVLYVDAAATIATVWTPTSILSVTGGYASEAAAIADLAAAVALVPTANAILGYATIQAQDGQAWISGTDALAGGASGNEAQTTNYYEWGLQAA